MTEWQPDRYQAPPSPPKSRRKLLLGVLAVSAIVIAIAILLAVPAGVFY
jgi:hypothetical protein